MGRHTTEVRFGSNLYTDLTILRGQGHTIFTPSASNSSPSIDGSMRLKTKCRTRVETIFPQRVNSPKTAGAQLLRTKAFQRGNLCAFSAPQGRNLGRFRRGTSSAVNPTAPVFYTVGTDA